MAFGVLAPDNFVDGSVRVLQEAGFEAVSSPFLFKHPVCEVVWLPLKGRKQHLQGSKRK